MPRWKKELIIVAISRERNCRYCEAAHAACDYAGRECGLYGPGCKDNSRSGTAGYDPVCDEGRARSAKFG